MIFANRILVEKHGVASLDLVVVCLVLVVLSLCNYFFLFEVDVKQDLLLILL